MKIQKNTVKITLIRIGVAHSSLITYIRKNHKNIKGRKDKKMAQKADPDQSPRIGEIMARKGKKARQRAKKPSNQGKKVKNYQIFIGFS